MVNKQNPIEFINDCGAIVDYKELRNAVLWYTDKPQTSKKHIFLHGRYPAVSIFGQKIHIHRLLMMYWLNSNIPTEYSVHHINGNRMDARKENLAVMLNSAHNSNHNVGRKPPKVAIDKLVEFNHSRKGTRQKKHRGDISTSKVRKMLEDGYSINKISIELGCDWSTIKSRQKEIHDNPEISGGNDGTTD